MTQLVRIKPGKEIEEAHMRGRSAIAHWVYEKGKTDKVIEMFQQDGKSYVKISDYKKLQTLFGELLREIQRVNQKAILKVVRILLRILVSGLMCNCMLRFWSVMQN